MSKLFAEPSMLTLLSNICCIFDISANEGNYAAAFANYSLLQSGDCLIFVTITSIIKTNK